LDVLVAMIQGLVSVGINAYQAGTCLDGALDLGPQVDVRRESISTPENYETGEMKVLDVSPDLDTSNGVSKPLTAGRGTDSTSQPARTKPVEEPAVHAGAVYHTHCPAVAVWKNCFRTIDGSCDLFESGRDFIECFVPGYAGESAFTFGADTPHRIKQPPRTVNALEVSLDF